MNCERVKLSHFLANSTTYKSNRSGIYAIDFTVKLVVFSIMGDNGNLC